MEQESDREAQRLAELAGIRVPDERVPGLVAGLAMAQGIGQALARLDYGNLEPACRFRPPRPERQ